MVNFEKIPYEGWADCLRLSNGSVQLIVTTLVGPRVVHFGPAQQDVNLMWLDKETLGDSGGSEWTPYGGHRLWLSPEEKPKTYAPDNDSVDYQWDGSVLHITQRMEELTGIQKMLEIRMDPVEPRVSLVHKLMNRGQTDVQGSPWALTMLAPGGTAMIPNEPFVPFPEQLLPSRSVTLWSYTRMKDARILWEDDFTGLKQDAETEDPVKFGVRNSLNWGAYVLDGLAFVKTVELEPEAVYPDFGCNWEVFTDANFLELETLGPLQTIKAAGGEASHKEEWHLEEISGDADLQDVFSQLHRTYGRS